jgi:ATP-binding cassette subfamily B protein
MYIKDGKIAEIGTHDELMEKKGLYYQLYWTQHAEETSL